MRRVVDVCQDEITHEASSFQAGLCASDYVWCSTRVDPPILRLRSQMCIASVMLESPSLLSLEMSNVTVFGILIEVE